MPNFVYHSWMRSGNNLSALCYCPTEISVTPKVGPVTADTPLGKGCDLTLVPYCTTRLRIAIFSRIPSDL